MSSRRRSKFGSPMVESHFVDLIECLALESAAELERMNERRQRKSRIDLERTGEVIFDLTETDESPTVGQRINVTYVKRGSGLPWHKLKVGSPVLVFDQQDTAAEPEKGVICRVLRDSIQVSLSHVPEGKLFCIELTADELTRQRQLEAILTVKDSRGRLGQLRDIMMGLSEPRFTAATEIEFHSSLNPSQQEAVCFALSAQDVAIIHGPPGTGKTTTVIELIIQAVKRGDKVLAVAPSNTAVDNLLEKLVAAKQRVVRLGHPARVSESLRSYSLDGLAEQHENAEIIRDMVREAEMIYRQSRKWTRAKRSSNDRAEQRREARTLIQQARQMERFTIESILSRADVLCSTTSINDDLLGDRWFDLVVIDEACQTTEPGSWVPMLRCEKVVLAGDHRQLPPTILSAQASQRGLGKSLLERQIEQYGTKINRILTVQYRMHEQIMRFSSGIFYEDRLLADDAVRDHLLIDFPTVEPNDFTQTPVQFIDTAGAGFDDQQEVDGFSKFNTHEARLVEYVVQQLLASGVNPSQIAVVAPYAAQVRLLRTMIYSMEAGLLHGDHSISELEIDTVDGFQGREKEAIIISLVTSNPRQEIGFLSDLRRMNVALTRARRKLVVIGDSATLASEPFYQQFFDYVDSIQAYSSVWQICPNLANDSMG